MRVPLVVVLLLTLLWLNRRRSSSTKDLALESAQWRGRYVAWNAALQTVSLPAMFVDLSAFDRCTLSLWTELCCHLP